jgi:hypothetical protein
MASTPGRSRDILGGLFYGRKNTEVATMSAHTQLGRELPVNRWEKKAPILQEIFFNGFEVRSAVATIGLFASKLPTDQRTAYLTLYAGVVFLLIVILGDAMGAVPSRLAVDLVLLVGGLALGVYAGELFPIRLLRGTKTHLVRD